jgi:hypothetical protein
MYLLIRDPSSMLIRCDKYVQGLKGKICEMLDRAQATLPSRYLPTLKKEIIESKKKI